MPDAPFAIRALSASDAPAYNAFFARGAAAHPDTLRITPGDVASSPFSTEPTADAITFAAVGPDGAWLGVGSIERERGREKRRHIAWVVRMYVDSARAGRGVGRAILRAAIERAGQMPGVEKVNLTVAAHNERAVGLYRSEGFVPFSREPDAFRSGGLRVEELSMSLSLSAPE